LPTSPDSSTSGQPSSLPAPKDPSPGKWSRFCAKWQKILNNKWIKRAFTLGRFLAPIAIFLTSGDFRTLLAWAAGEWLVSCTAVEGVLVFLAELIGIGVSGTWIGVIAFGLATFIGPIIASKIADAADWALTKCIGEERAQLFRNWLREKSEYWK